MFRHHSQSDLGNLNFHKEMRDQSKANFALSYQIGAGKVIKVDQSPLGVAKVVHKRNNSAG